MHEEGHFSLYSCLYTVKTIDSKQGSNWGVNWGEGVYLYLGLLSGEFLLKSILMTTDFKINSSGRTWICEYTPSNYHFSYGKAGARQRTTRQVSDYTSQAANLLYSCTHDQTFYQDFEPLNQFRPQVSCPLPLPPPPLSPAMSYGPDAKRN